MEPFTKEYILRNSVKIFAGNKQILIPNIKYLPKDDIRLPSFITGSEQSALPRRVRQSTSLAELRSLGFGIVTEKVEKPWQKSQRITYQLRRLDDPGKFATSIPKDVYFQYDSANKEIKLIGKFVGHLGTTGWIPITMESYTRPEKKFTTIYEVLDNRDRVLDKYKNHLGMDTRKRVFIKDLPIGKTDANEILCIKKPETLTEEVEPRILVTGMPGTGKSTFCHAYLSRLIPYWGVRPIIYNDSQSETGEWCYPDEQRGLSFGLPYGLNKLDESQRGMQIVYLTPNTNETIKIMHEDDGVGYKISLPFKDIVINAHKYFNLQGSAKYFTAKTADFLGCETPEEVVNVFATGDKELSYEEYNVLVKTKQIPPRDTPQKTSIDFVRAIFNDLHQKKIIDKWCGVPSDWKVYINGEYIGTFNPLLACLVTGLVPDVQTADLLSKKYFATYYSYFANDIFEAQRTNEYLNKQGIKFCGFIDEITDIAKVGKTGPAYEVFEQWLRKGRFRRCGTCMSTQFYNDVPPTLRMMCDYLIAFNSGETSDKICYDAGLSRVEINRVKNLNQFEFMAYAKQTPFIIYDMDGNKRTEKGPIYATLLPPLSIHSAPVRKSEKGKI